MKHVKNFNQDLNENNIWREVENNIEPWDMNIMDKLLDKFEEKYYSLEEHSWEQIQEIKKALWIGYNYRQ